MHVCVQDAFDATNLSTINTAEPVVKQINFGPVSCCSLPRLPMSEVRSGYAVRGQRLRQGQHSKHANVREFSDLATETETHCDSAEYILKQVIGRPFVGK